MRILLVLTLVIISFSSHAQSNGYMGKKHILSADFALSGSYYRLIVEKEKLWKKYGGNYEFLVSKKIGLGLAYQFEKNQYNESYTDEYFDYSGFNMISNTYSINCNFYSRQTIAPLGNFVRLHLFMIRNKSTDYYSNGTPKSNIDPYSFPGYSQDYIAAVNYGFSIELGYRRILYNSIVITLGSQFGLTLYNPVSNFLINDFSPGATENSTFKNFVLDQNFRSNIFVLKLGIGGIF